MQIAIVQYGIALEDIYNFDEREYVMGLVATAREFWMDYIYWVYQCNRMGSTTMYYL